jgi:hypothetical protein
VDRFADRTKRILRRQESDAFRVYIVPASWLVCAFGVAGLIATGVEYLIHASTSPVLIRILATFAVAPLLVGAVRWARGHFSPDVRNQ